MPDSKDWERVGLRVHPDQLRRWEAVCTPADPNKSDDHIVNEFPHLYDTKSNLIRTAVSELISRETGELDTETAETESTDNKVVKEKVERVYTETRDIREIVDEMRDRQEDILTESVRTRDDVVSEAYDLLPRISGDRADFIEMMEENLDDGVFELEYTDPHRADELGYWLDLMAHFEDESDGVVLDSLEKLVEDVDEVSKATIDGKRFYFKV